MGPTFPTFLPIFFPLEDVYVLHYPTKATLPHGREYPVLDVFSL